MEEIQREKEKNYALPGSIVLAAILISGSIFYVSGKAGEPSGVVAPKLTAEQLALVGGVTASPEGRDVVIGDPKAPVTMIEYADYQCPFCGRFYKQTLPRVIEAYVKTGKVKLIHRNFAFLGPESFAAAEAAECAKDQGKFWPYQFSLYEEEQRDGREHNGNLAKDLFLAIAGNLKMDKKAFASCVDERTYARAVTDEVAQGQKDGVSSTPTFLVNGEKVIGALPFESFADAEGVMHDGFQAILDRAVDKAVEAVSK